MKKYGESIGPAPNGGGRPLGTTRAVMDGRRAAAGVDHLGLPLEPDRGGRSGRVGRNLRPERQDEVRAKIRASHLVARLQDNADGLIEMTPGQIKSAEILLSKSLSSLSSTEVVNVNSMDRMSESELFGRIGELIEAHPELLQMIGKRPAVIDHASPAPPCIVCGSGGLPGGCPACGAGG